MHLGDTFAWSPRGTTGHLYIVVSDPNKGGGEFVVFNLTKSAHGRESFILRKGDHPFITKDSDVNFGDGMIVSAHKIKAELASRHAFPHPPMEARIVSKIAHRAITHPAVSGEIQEMLKAQLLQPDEPEL